MHLRSSSGFYGAERVIITLMKRATDIQIDASLACIENYINGDQSLLQHAQQAGLNACELPCKGRFDLSMIKEMEKICRDQGINVIHSHDYKSHFYATLVARRLGCKQVATLHGKTLGGIKNRIFEQFENLLLRFSDHITVVSEPLYESLLKTSLKNKISLVANGVDEYSFTPDVSGFGKTYWGFKPDHFVFGTIARMSEEKGHSVLLAAFAKLLAENDQARLLLVGDGFLKDQLQVQAKELGIDDKLNFSGIRYEVEQILSDIDCYVSPSFTEGMPMSILEAMATALPIVATDVGSVGYLLRDGFGKVVPPADDDGLARGMQAIIDQQEQAGKMGQKCRERVVTELSAGVQGQEYAKIYSALTSN